ncbi:MAG: hypothetical protein WDN28_08665 [Chthoniobacter sp.]
MQAGDGEAAFVEAPLDAFHERKAMPCPSSTALKTEIEDFLQHRFTVLVTAGVPTGRKREHQ